MLLDRLQEALVGLQLFLGVAVLDLGLVDERLGVIEVVLEQRFGLLLVRIDERPGDLFLEHLEVFLVQRVLQVFQELLARVVGKIGLLHHADQRLADVDRVDAVALDVVGECVVERLHDEARGDAAHTFALGIVAAIPSAWFLAGESGLATMIVIIVLTFVFTALSLAFQTVSNHFMEKHGGSTSGKQRRATVRLDYRGGLQLMQVLRNLLNLGSDDLLIGQFVK